MKIELIPLNTKGRVDFDKKVELTEYTNTMIDSIEEINVKGYIIDNGTEDYEINLHITGYMYLKSAINSNKVPYKLDIQYEDFITNLVENYKNSSNSLDILPIIWENILLEIPMRAVNEEDAFVSVKGEGWEVLTSE